MNRKQGKANGKRKTLGKRRHSKFEHYLAYLRRTYGAQWDESIRGNDDKYRVMLLTYGPSQVPRRMPSPHGPMPGASMSILQSVQSLTLASSSTYSSGLLYQNSATEGLVAIPFCLADLNQVSTLSALFDQYRIDRIHLRIRPKNTAFFLASVASPNQSSPDVWVAADFDDGSTPTSVASIREYQNAVVLNAGDSLDMIIEPSVTPAVYSGGAFSGYGVEASRWLDVANTSIPHYGVKIGITALQASATYSYQWDVEAWYTVSFRNIR